MSLVTTCPNCGTAFIVRPEQLAAHRGDVQCGQCQHLFNALEHLAEAKANEQETPTTDIPESEAASTEDHDIVDEIAPAPDSTIPQPEQAADESEAPQEPLIDEAAADEALVEPFHTDVVASDVTEPAASEMTDPDIEDALPQEIPVSEASSEPEPEPEPEPAIVKPETSPVTPLFLSPTSPKKKHGKWWGWLLISLILIVSAGLQSAYFLRTELLIQAPQTKPLLTWMCNMLNCKIDLPRKIDLITIDDSDLQEDADHDQVVILTTTLINHAHFAQAYPQLELTLTDTGDHAVLRRLFAPSEYLPSGTAIQPGMPAEGEVHIKLPIVTQAIKASGYRVFITY